MGYRIRETGEYVATDSALRSRMVGQIRPATKITAELLESIGVDPVFEGAQATGGTVYQYSMYSGLENIDGKWYTKYVLGPKFVTTTDEDGKVTTAAEHEAAYKARKDAERADQMRADRNKRLTETDWTQLADSSVDKQVWATYRQALRDVPAQDGFPWNVTWPEQP